MLLPQEHPNEDWLHFAESYLGKPIFEHSIIKVPIRNIWVMKGYPGHESDKRYEACLLIYEDVVYSYRKIWEYQDQMRTDFNREYFLHDDFSGSYDGKYTFGLEGVSDDLNAWISWDIVARNMYIVEDERKG